VKRGTKKISNGCEFVKGYSKVFGVTVMFVVVVVGVTFM